MLSSNLQIPIEIAKRDSTDAVAQLKVLLERTNGRVRIGVQGGNRVTLGNDVVFTVHSDLAGRLIVINLNANGDVIQILPNKFTTDAMSRVSAGADTDTMTRVSIGSDITVPGPNYGFKGFKAVEPTGRINDQWTRSPSTERS